MGRKRRSRSRAYGSQRRSRALVLEGTLHIVRPGVATVETQEGTFHVARGGIREGMDGDLVRVTLSRHASYSQPQEPRAYVQSVMARACESFLGTYGVASPLGVVVPLDERIRRDFFVLPDDKSADRLGIKEGDLVVARILTYPTRREAGVVTLDRRVGASDEIDIDIESVIASYNLPCAFPERVLKETDALTLDVDGVLAAQPYRRDLRKGCCFTIDPVDARDFDDALSVDITDQGYTLGVHIADVSQYVPQDSPLDIEARARGCSVYLADRVLPMLPERLSNDICSLRPNEDRLCMSVLIDLSLDGEVQSFEITPSAICSQARLDYDSVERLLEGKSTASDLTCDATHRETIAQALMTLDKVAEKRRVIRKRRGSIDFETAEAKIVLDKKGEPQGVRIRERTNATSLVEEAMLVANECVAQRLAQADMASAYRVHEPPIAERLESALVILHELELVNSEESELIAAGDPFAVQTVLERVRGASSERLVTSVLLRAQSRAVYAPHNEGHYALGARAYCHFTSPIRRYPDLVIHRSIKALLGVDTSVGIKGKKKDLPQLCRSCSELERRADSAARASQRAKLARFYLDRIGEVCGGVISGVEKFGLFVELEETLAEGLVPILLMSYGSIRFDEKRMLLRNDHDGHTWRLGQRVAVRIEDADPAHGKITLTLVGGATGRVPGGLH